MRASAGDIACCTILARNYLAHAQVLARSLLEHEPQARFYALVIDGLPDSIQIDPRVRLIGPEALDLPDFAELAFKYDVVELCTAVKARLLDLLLREYDEDAVVYLDPDILVTRPLVELRQPLDEKRIVLTPHLLTPLPLDGLHPREQEMMMVGVFNLGFLALAKSGESHEFLAWWHERLRDGCLRDPQRGMFVDQRWIDQVPALFPSMTVLRDDTYNVAYWNLYARSVEHRDGRFLINGRPLTFFHFSNVDVAAKAFRQTHWNRTQLTASSALASLIDLYAALVEQAGHHTSKQWEYGYSRFDNKKTIDMTMRCLYRSLSNTQRAAFRNPFQTGPGSFLEWATTADGAGQLSPFLSTLHAIRPDVSAAFPDPVEKDRSRFLEWARTSGAREMGFAPDIVLPGKVAARPRPERISNIDVVRVLDITAIERSLLDSAALVGASIDFPRVGDVLDHARVDIQGWALGREVPVADIEVLSDNAIAARTSCMANRPDVAVAFPSVRGAERSGFSVAVECAEKPEIRLSVQAILQDGRVIKLGALCGRTRSQRPASSQGGTLVSIVIPSLDTSPLLHRAIDSALLQTHRHVEVIVVVSDAKASDTWAGERGVRQVVSGSLDIADAWNVGIRRSNGQYLVFLGPDEVLLPEAIEHGLKSFEVDSAFGVVRGRARLASVTRSMSTDESGSPGGVDTRESDGKEGAHASGCALYRRAAIEAVGVFESHSNSLKSDELFCRIAERFQAYEYQRTIVERFVDEIETA